MATDEVWVLGGSGRSGRAIATELVQRDLSPVLVGRDGARLAVSAARIGGAPTMVVDSLQAMTEAIGRGRPAAVVNTIGPFTATAEPIARACLAGSHYLDLANDVAAVSTLLNLHEAAVAAGRTLVTGAGFGVTATESVVVQLCRERPSPAAVRVDAVPSLEIEEGPVGVALAATILGGLPDARGRPRYEGRRYRDGRLVRARLGDDAAPLRLPDGARVVTAGLPLGELIAAQRASGAPSVIAASSEAPTSLAVRALLPLASVLLGNASLRAAAVRRLARVQFKPRGKSREHSWAHAELRWADGSTRHGWLRVGDAQIFTGAAAAEVARRLVAGEGRAGAHTPATLLGPSLAAACGGEYVIDDALDAAPDGDALGSRQTPDVRRSASRRRPR